MHAATPNIVGATMLGVVSSVCTQPKTTDFFARASHFFVHFFAVTLHDTKWKCLTSRFVEDVNTKQRRSFSFPQPLYSFLEELQQLFQHLTRWNKRDKFGSSPNSFFKWRFRILRRLFCLSSLMIDPKHSVLGYVHAALDAVENSCEGLLNA